MNNGVKSNRKRKKLMVESTFELETEDKDVEGKVGNVFGEIAVLEQ